MQVYHVGLFTALLLGKVGVEGRSVQPVHGYVLMLTRGFNAVG